MSLKPLFPLNEESYLNASLDYKMDKKTAFRFPDVENDRLISAVSKMNHKAALGLLTALCEWVFWRLKKHCDIQMCIDVLEANWAGSVSKLYMKPWKYACKYEISIVQSPIWIAIQSLRITKIKFIRGDKFIFSEFPTMVALVNHICPDKKQFESWLSDCIKRAVQYFPAGYNYFEALEEDDDEMYDSTNEPVIPREFFFDSTFKYEKSYVNNLLQAFLGELNYQDNSFLETPELMLSRGFKGIPYKVE